MVGGEKMPIGDREKSLQDIYIGESFPSAEVRLSSFPPVPCIADKHSEQLLALFYDTQPADSVCTSSVLNV